MKKVIVYDEEARTVLKKGVDAVADAVKITIGPKGRNVAYDSGFGGPTISNDGVSIAREVILEDPLENIGANIIKEVSQKTNDAAGDGTTTAIVIMQAIVEDGMKKIEVGINAIGIKNGIEKASRVAVEYLRSIAKPIKVGEETTQVATISSESAEIGRIITDTVSKLGEEAVITVEKSNTVGITSEVSQGLELDKGFISPYMVTDPSRMEAVCKDVSILVTDFKIGAVQEIVPFLEAFMASGKRELVVIAEDIVGEALQTFIVNKMRGSVTIIGVKAPGFGERKKDYLEDIAVVTGATLISQQVGLELKDITLEHLGSADRVISNKDKTTIVGGKGTKEAIRDRIASAKVELKNLESKHDILKVEERIAKLSGGVAVIKVGASTETESDYIKLKVEDAVNAVKAALAEGIVPGGGSALIGASKAIVEVLRHDAKKKESEFTTDEAIGYRILANALESPLRQIAKNSGKGDGTMVVEKVREMDSKGGYDAMNNVYVEDMTVVGIADPVKVSRSAIENAASAGGTLLTTSCAIATVVEKNNSPTPQM